MTTPVPDDLQEYWVGIGMFNCIPPYTEHAEFAEMERVFGPAIEVEVSEVKQGGEVVAVLKKGKFGVRSRSQGDANLVVRCYAQSLLANPREYDVVNRRFTDGK